MDNDSRQSLITMSWLTSAWNTMPRNKNRMSRRQITPVYWQKQGGVLSTKDLMGKCPNHM